MPLPSATEPYDEHAVAWAPGTQAYKGARKYNGSITDCIACVDPYAHPKIRLQIRLHISPKMRSPKKRNPTTNPTTCSRIISQIRLIRLIRLRTLTTMNSLPSWGIAGRVRIIKLQEPHPGNVFLHAC